jgi:sporulation protein YlmC with PRC-barrel domain
MEIEEMLKLMKKITGYALHATDGEIGKVHDFLFDDQSWQVRYLVIDTGKWLPGRKVVVPPSVIADSRWEERELPVSMSKEQIKDAPPLSEHEPVSRQHEVDLYQYFQWQPYWAGGALLGEPYATNTSETRQDEGTVREDSADTDVSKTGEKQEQHLRSFRELKGYSILAQDSEAGKLDDFILDDKTWKSRYLVVDIGSWLPGKDVLVPTDWISEVHWAQATVTVNVPIVKLKEAPEFDPDEPVDREFEKKLYDHYEKPAYWTSMA